MGRMQNGKRLSYVVSSLLGYAEAVVRGMRFVSEASVPHVREPISVVDLPVARSQGLSTLCQSIQHEDTCRPWKPFNSHSLWQLLRG